MELKRVVNQYRFGLHFYVNELRNIIMVAVSIFTLRFSQNLFVEYFDKINNENQVNNNSGFSIYIKYLMRTILTFFLISLILIIVLSIMYVNSFYSMRSKLYEHFKNNFATHSNTPDIYSFESYYCSNENFLVIDYQFKIKVDYFCFMHDVFENYYIEF